MRSAILILTMIATAPPALALPAAGAVKGLARKPPAVRLSVEALCARLTLAEVTSIVGKEFERRPEREKTHQVCEYGDGREKGQLRTRYFSLGSSRLTEAAWRRFVEVEGKGQVVERDGILVSHFRRDRFGTDSLWFRDRQGHALELNVNAGVTEEQAVALAKAAMD